MEGGKKRKRTPCCGFQGLGQETPCQNCINMERATLTIIA
jgi:hypothetical protein